MDDSYEPFEDPLWGNHVVENDNESNYIQRLFQNGEMYVDRGWGNINLALWQIFIDKQHGKEVGRDYVLQCDFEFLVERANKKVYCNLFG